MSANECRCGRVTRGEAWFVCETCQDALARDLDDVAWLEVELEVTITRQRGIPTEGTSAGSARCSCDDDAACPHASLPWHEAASNARRVLHGLLVSWVQFCDEERVRHDTWSNALPTDSLGSMASWLTRRVEGLACLDIGPEAVDELGDAIAGCRRVIDRQPDRWYAGPCSGCGRDLYARSRRGRVACPECSTEHDVEARRAWLLNEAEDRLASAATVARAVSWLGAAPLTPSRVRVWAQRGRIIVKGHDGRRPLYRIGDALDLLAAESVKAS